MNSLKRRASGRVTTPPPPIGVALNQHPAPPHRTRRFKHAKHAADVAGETFSPRLLFATKEIRRFQVTWAASDLGGGGASLPFDPHQTDICLNTWISLV